MLNNRATQRSASTEEELLSHDSDNQEEGLVRQVVFLHFFVNLEHRYSSHLRIAMTRLLNC